MGQLGTEAFSSVPRLPAWSFLRLICGGVLPPPHCPDMSGPAVSLDINHALRGNPDDKELLSLYLVFHDVYSDVP